MYQQTFRLLVVYEPTSFLNNCSVKYDNGKNKLQVQGNMTKHTLHISLYHSEDLIILVHSKYIIELKNKKKRYQYNIQ